MDKHEITWHDDAQGLRPPTSIEFCFDFHDSEGLGASTSELSCSGHWRTSPDHRLWWIGASNFHGFYMFLHVSTGNCTECFWIQWPKHGEYWWTNHPICDPQRIAQNRKPLTPCKVKDSSSQLRWLRNQKMDQAVYGEESMHFAGWFLRRFHNKRECRTL